MLSVALGAPRTAPGAEPPDHVVPFVHSPLPAVVFVVAEANKAEATRTLMPTAIRATLFIPLPPPSVTRRPP